MIFAIAAVGLVTVVVSYVLFKHFIHPSLPAIRGPRSPSFIFGNTLEFFQLPAGQLDFELKNLYGDVVRLKTVFGVDQLWIADPKVVQRILHASPYRYSKLRSTRVIAHMLNGKGIIWAEGEDHKRHKKVLLPGFGGPETKAFLAIFSRCAKSMCLRWMEAIGNNADKNIVIDIHPWIARGTLDAVGQAAFDVDFGALQDDSHPLAMIYRNHMSDIFGRPSTLQIFIQAASEYIPTLILQWMVSHGSNRRLKRARELKKATTDVARELVREKAESLLAGKGSRDVFSLLVKANMDEETKNKLSEEELLAQMRTILFAGHETTSNTLSWMLLELARHPDIQSKLRREIHMTEAAIRARGDTQFTLADFDGMAYMTAVVKEGLRYHPVVPRITRVTSRDEVLQLARPIATESGEMINEIVVKKGTDIVLSIAAYNRHKDLWGEDAHEFNPDRWLDGVASKQKEVPIGVYSNLLTFSGGARACIGWRFAVIETQAFLIEIINKFELTATDRSERVCRTPIGFMTPMVDGEWERGAQLPFEMSIAAREDNY